MAVCAHARRVSQRTHACTNPCARARTQHAAHRLHRRHHGLRSGVLQLDSLLHRARRSGWRRSVAPPPAFVLCGAAARLRPVWRRARVDAHHHHHARANAPHTLPAPPPPPPRAQRPLNRLSAPQSARAPPSSPARGRRSPPQPPRPPHRAPHSVPRWVPARAPARRGHTQRQSSDRACGTHAHGNPGLIGLARPAALDALALGLGTRRRLLAVPLSARNFLLAATRAHARRMVHPLPGHTHRRTRAYARTHTHTHTHTQTHTHTHTQTDNYVY